MTYEHRVSSGERQPRGGFMSIALPIICAFAGYALGIVTMAAVVAGRRADEAREAREEMDRRLAAAAQAAAEYDGLMGEDV
jgi:hypothetical protein